jgi:hypothetical protein
MNDSLDEMHSDREDGIIPSVKEIAALFLLWLIVMLFLAFGFAGCLSS